MTNNIVQSSGTPQSEGAVRIGETTSNNDRSSFVRFNILIIGLQLALFLSALDITIVTTALLTIANAFDGLRQSSWIVVAFLLTYNGFILIASKLSDNFGPKNMLLGSLVMFLVFSVACGESQSMTQLITFRALQGIGASGVYSLVFVVVMKTARPEHIGFYSGVISSVFAFANCLGPVLGGVIADKASWRYVFFLNAPVLGIALIVTLLSMPGLDRAALKRSRFGRVDVIGAILNLAWTIPLVFALQQGGLPGYAWSSSPIIGTLAAGGIGLLLFCFWEAWVGISGQTEPIFPMRFLTDPIVALTLLVSCFTGATFYVAVIELPQRFQSVNAASPARAGLLLLCFTCVSPVFAIAAGFVSGKRLHAAPYFILSGACFVLLGSGLLSTLPPTIRIPDAQYGFQVLMGVGLGLIGPNVYVVLKEVVSEDDLAAVTGATNMFRTIGGALGIAICSSVLRARLKFELPAILDKTQIEALDESFSSLADLPSQDMDRVRQAYGRGFNESFRVMIGFAGANLVVALLLVLVKTRAAWHTRPNPAVTNVEQGSTVELKSSIRVDSPIEPERCCIRDYQKVVP